MWERTHFLREDRSGKTKLARAERKSPWQYTSNRRANIGGTNSSGTEGRSAKAPSRRICVSLSRWRRLAERNLLKVKLGSVTWRAFRSEERRVGKECRCRWRPY